MLLSTNQQQSNTADTSIIVSVFNGGQSLTRCLASIATQSYTQYNIIAVDDASTDNTLDILEHWQAKLGVKRFQIIKNKKNIGLTRSLNKAIAQTRTPFIARIDADDTWHEQKLELQLNFLKKHPEVGVLGCWYINDYGAHTRAFRLSIKDKKLKREIFRKNPFGHSCVIIRREVLEKVHGYDEHIYFGQDRDIWFRMMPHTKFHNLPHALVTRQATNTISQRHIKAQMWQGIKTRFKYMKMYRASFLDYLFLVEPLCILLIPEKFKRYIRSGILSKPKKKTTSLLYIDDRPLVPYRAETVARQNMAKAFADNKQIQKLVIRNIKPWQALTLNIPEEIDTIYLRGGAIANSLLALRNIRRKRKVILEVHNMLFGKNPLIDTLYKFAFFQANLLVTIAPIVKKNWVKANIPAEKIIVLPSAIAQDAHSRKSNTRAQLREELSLPNDKKLIIYAGSLYRDRGIEDIISCAQMFAKNEQALFIIVGGTKSDVQHYRKYAENTFGELRNLRFLGYKPHDHIPAYLTAADMVLVTYSRKCPTIDTMSPLKLVEALASGRPIVAPDLPRIREMVDVKKIHTYTADNPKSLARAIQRILDNPLATQTKTNQAPSDVSLYTWNSRVAIILRSV